MKEEIFIQALGTIIATIVIATSTFLFKKIRNEWSRFKKILSIAGYIFFCFIVPIASMIYTYYFYPFDKYFVVNFITNLALIILAVIGLVFGFILSQMGDDFKYQADQRREWVELITKKKK